MQIKALTVSVGFADLLELSLPTVLPYVEKLMVITDSNDMDTISLCNRMGVTCYVTDAFYRHDATFNKGLAVEEGLGAMGRDGWIFIFDADILLPEGIDFESYNLHKQVLYGANRRICKDPSTYDHAKHDKYPIKSEGEIAGFFQLFNGLADPLKKRPWYGTNWKHAGGCDSVFQSKFHPHNKEKLPIEVIHLGEDGVNWHGRVSTKVDGSKPDKADKNLTKQKEMFATRRRNRAYNNPYKEEIY